MNEFKLKTLRTDDIDIEKGKILIYGKSGTGKTYSVSTLDAKKTIVITPDKNALKVLKKLNWIADLWHVEKWEYMFEFSKILLQPDMQKKYDNIFVDDFTEINELSKEWIVKVERPATKGLTNTKTYSDLMELQDYMLLQVKITNLLRAFRDLPYNCIFTCLEDEVRDEQSGIILFRPSMNGKMRLNMTGFFDEVFRLIVDKDGERVFLCDNTEKELAKDRSGYLDKYECPDYAKILKKIKGEK